MVDENSELLRSAIEHICFLADVNQLYDEALGLYRIDIALLIAQKSQKVPPQKAVRLITGSTGVSSVFAALE
jgi:hypothetical protein